MLKKFKILFMVIGLIIGMCSILEAGTTEEFLYNHTYYFVQGECAKHAHVAIKWEPKKLWGAKWKMIECGKKKGRIYALGSLQGDFLTYHTFGQNNKPQIVKIWIDINNKKINGQVKIYDYYTHEELFMLGMNPEKLKCTCSYD